MSEKPESEAARAFDRGVLYESTRDLVNFSIAHHMSAIYKIADDRIPESVRHHKDARDLIEVRNRLDPDRPEISEVVRLILGTLNHGSYPLPDEVRRKSA